MKILVTFALETEFAPWRRLRGFERVVEANFAVYETRVSESHVRVVLTGIGAAPAKRVAANALAWHPDVCVSAGFAGSLRSSYSREDVFVPREVMELESGRTLETDRALCAVAEARGLRVIDRLLSASTMILTASGKGRLGRMAEAVEMESFAILTEAAARKVPTTVIRAISDSADEDLPMDLGVVLDEAGKVDGSKLVRRLARSPHKIPALVRLGRNSHRAAKKLAHFLDAFVYDLAQDPARRAALAEATRA